MQPVIMAERGGPCWLNEDEISLRRANDRFCARSGPALSRSTGRSDWQLGRLSPALPLGVPPEIAAAQPASAAAMS